MDVFGGLYTSNITMGLLLMTEWTSNSMAIELIPSFLSKCKSFLTIYFNLSEMKREVPPPGEVLLMSYS